MDDTDSTDQRWYIQGLREAVENKRSKVIADELWLCLSAFNDRQFYAFFHFKEVLRLLKVGLGGREDPQRVLADIVLRGDGQASDVFDEYRKQAWAHVLGCLHNLHAIADIMGHVLVLSLGLIPKGRTSMMSARACVNDPELTRLLTSWLDHPDHQYLDAVVNFSKHHSLVREQFQVDLTGERERAFGFMLSSFHHKRQTYAPRWVTDTLPAIVRREAPLVGQIGRRISDLLGADQSPRDGHG